MAALEVVSFFSTAPTAVYGAVPVAFSSGTGTIRNFSSGNAWLAEAWQCQNTTAGGMRVRSPRMHDFVNGIRLQAEAANCQPLLPMGFAQRLIAQDVLTIELAGSAVAGDIVNGNLLIYYESLDSANGRFTDLNELENRMVNVIGLPFALVGGVAGAYAGGTALNAGTAGAILKANTDYAVLGMVGSKAAGTGIVTVGITGADTGNLRIGIPAGVQQVDTRDFFIQLTKRYNRPLVPVLNSANAGGTILDVLNDENACTYTMDLILAELR